MCIRDRINSAVIGKLDSSKESFISEETVECDCICMSGGWTPTVHLSSQAGNKLKFNDEIDAFVPDKKRQKETAIGAANGSFTLNQSLAEVFKWALIYQTNLQIKIILQIVPTQMNLAMKNMKSSGVCLYHLEKNQNALSTFKMTLQFLM